MASIVLGYFEQKGLKARLHNNGDDCMVILDAKDLRAMDDIDEWFREFGFKLTQERPVYCFEEIQFCQTQPVLLSTGWRMIRDPRVSMSKDRISIHKWDDENNFNEWRNAIATCGLHLCTGVPMLEAWYRKLWVPHQGTRYKDIVRREGLGRLSLNISSEAVITETTRYSFYLAFGILPDQQRAFEDDVPEVGWMHPEPPTNLDHFPSDFADLKVFHEQIQQKEELNSYTWRNPHQTKS